MKSPARDSEDHKSLTKQVGLQGRGIINYITPVPTMRRAGFAGLPCYDATRMLPAARPVAWCTVA